MARKTKKTKALKPVRIGLIGIGRAGWGMHVQELAKRMDKFEFVAACDVDPKRCKMMADKFGCATYETVEELIADPNVELVDIASRSPEHVEHATLALRAGKHVFLEKPIALTYTEAKTLERVSKTAKGKLFIRHNRRFEPAFQHIREIIDSGLLGDVYEIRLRRTGYQRRDDWQTIIECGGGQFLNWGPHLVDHALQFVDGKVASIWSDLRLVAAAGDAEDHLNLIVKGESGRTVDIQISGGKALSEPVYLVSGTKGALRCEDEKTIQLKYLNPRKKLKARKADPGTPPFGGFGGKEKLPWVEKSVKVKAPYDTDAIWDFLYESVRNRKAFPIKLEEALQVMEVISKAKKGTPFEGTVSTKKKPAKKTTKKAVKKRTK